MLEEQGDLEAAKPLYEQSLEINKKILGEDHPSVATSLNNLGLLVESMGDKEAANVMGKKALQICLKALGADHPKTKQYQRDWG